MRALDEIRNEVKLRRSRKYLDEAISAYSAAAFRSALLSLWIAVVSDIIDKISILSDREEGAAIKKRQELDRAVSRNDILAMQNYERGLIEAAFDLQLIGAREKLELERLKEDRNACAHPAFIQDDELFNPTPELVRSHITTAVESLLGREPVTGKKALERFARDLSGESFPTEKEKVRAYLKSSYLEHGTKSLKANLSRVGCKMILDVKPYEGPHEAELHEKLITTLTVLHEEIPLIFHDAAEGVLSRRQEEFDDDTLILFACGLGRIDGMLDVLNPGVTARLEQRIKTVDIDVLVLSFDAFSPLPKGPVGDLLAAEFPRVLDGDDPFWKVASKHPDPRLTPYLLTALSNAYSYRRAEHILTWVTDFSDILTGEDFSEIFKAYLENDQVHGAFRSAELMAELYKRTASNPQLNDQWSEFRRNVEIRASNPYVPHHAEFEELRNMLDQ